MLAAANIAQQVIALELSVKIPMTTQDMDKYETLDKCITKCMLKAEKNAGNCTWVVFPSLLN